MKPNVGDRLSSEGSDTQVIVVRAPTEDVALTCGGAPLTAGDRPAGGGGAAPADDGGEGTQLGKRYFDEQTGLELLCTRAGAGALELAGRPLAIKQAKSLPSSD